MSDTTRTVISKSTKKRGTPKNSGIYNMTEQVVYKTPVGRKEGKMKYSSVTKHEISK